MRRQHPGSNLVVNIEPDPTERGLQQWGLLSQEGRSLFQSFMEAPRLAPHEHPHIFQSLPVFHKADARFPSQFYLRESLYLPPSACRAYAGSKLCNLAMMILALCLHQKKQPSTSASFFLESIINFFQKHEHKTVIFLIKFELWS